MTMDPYSMNTEQWDAHMEQLLDMALQHQTSESASVCSARSCTSMESNPLRSPPSKKQRTDHPMYISARQCHNKECGGRDADFIVDANGGSVVCILCGMIQDTAVLDAAITFADSEATSSVHVVHRYSRIAYVRGLLKSIEGETNVELTALETQAIIHHVTNHSSGTGGTSVELARKIKRAVTKMNLRKCLVYHAHTIAFRLFKSHFPAQNETQVRIALRRFRSLENEWDRAPRQGPLRQGTKKFPSIPWIWHRICHDMNLADIQDIFYLPRSQKKCTAKRECQYTQLTRLAGHTACVQPVS